MVHSSVVLCVCVSRRSPVNPLCLAKCKNKFALNIWHIYFSSVLKAHCVHRINTGVCMEPRQPHILYLCHQNSWNFMQRFKKWYIIKYTFGTMVSVVVKWHTAKCWLEYAGTEKLICPFLLPTTTQHQPDRPWGCHAISEANILGGGITGRSGAQQRRWSPLTTKDPYL